MNLYTIGFTKKNAESFFEQLRAAKVRRIIDVRLNNVSQLAGFSKRDDLQYLLKKICDIEYVHLPNLAPTQLILDAYKKGGGSWADYEAAFSQLMARKEMIKSLPISLLEGGCLLCSEAQPGFCHRRLLAEAAQHTYPGTEIIHLV